MENSEEPFNFVLSSYRAEIRMPRNVLPHRFVLLGQGHAVQECILCLLSNLPVPVKKVHQDRKYQELGVVVVVFLLLGSRCLTGRGAFVVVVVVLVALVVGVEEEVEEVEVFHEASTQLVEKQDEMRLGIGGSH